MPDEKIPVGLCQCGCGGRTKLAPQTDARRGWRRGEPQRFVNGHNTRAFGVPPCGWVEEDRGHSTPCHVWKLSLGPHGYGAMRHGDATQIAHIVLWVAEYGPVPDGLELDHLCRVRACVNVKHLEPVTHTENVRRGEHTRLTVSDVLAIRASPLSQATLARQYNVTRTAIYRIVHRKAWRDVGEEAA